MQRNQIWKDFRINKPYGFYIKGDFAFPFNRNYSNLGKEENYDFNYNFVYDDIDYDDGDNPSEIIHLYNDDTNPYSGWLKRIPNEDLLFDYNMLLEEFEIQYSVVYNCN